MSSTSELFRKIEELIPTLDGWCTPERACELAAMVVALKPKQTVVLGVWGGRDTYAIALAHQHNGFGKVLAIDPWAASASVVGQEGEDAAWWADQNKHDVVYRRFTDNMHRLGLSNWIDVRRERAADVEPPIELGLAVVDANHGPDSIADVVKWAPHVSKGNIVFCDDLSWRGGSVAEAVKRLKKIGFKHLYDRDTGAFFQRV